MANISTSKKGKANLAGTGPEKLNTNLKYIEKLSYGTQRDRNLILHGDNLKLLEGLVPLYEKKIQCIYIDPPYNNNEIYNHYNDNLSHARWKKDIVERIEKLHILLKDSGSLWISIDDREVHYLKVAVDKIFGRDNFVTTIVWQQRTTRENRKVFSNNHEYILLYAKDIKKFCTYRNSMPYPQAVINRYKNPDKDPRGPWQSISLNVQAGHAVKSQFYTIKAPNGRIHYPPNGRCWVYNEKRMLKEINENNIWFGKDGNGVPRRKKFLSSVQEGLTPDTLWLADDVGTNDKAKKHLLKMFPDVSVFDTPKPEHLIYRLLHIATNENDLVLDAYLGSGTTSAVAHKMGRRYIGIEKGNHIITHCVERLKFVCNGEEGGISDIVNWKGGGSFSFYKLKT